MAKILAMVDAPHWACMNVMKGVQEWSDHEMDIAFWWFKTKYHDFNPADYDITYLHSGAVLNKERHDYVKGLADDTKWILGFRGATAIHRVHKYFGWPFEAYSVSSEELYDIAQMHKATPAFVCHSGVDTSMFVPRPYPEEFTIGWCGTAAAGPKKFNHLMELPFKKILAGPARKTDPWYALGVRGRKHHTMPEFYEGCNVYVSTSNKEGSPLPPKEAAAMARPIIARRAGDLVEWIPEEYLVDDHMDMIPIIQKFKDNPDLVVKEGRMFRELVMQWDYSEVSKEYDYMFDRVMEE